MNKKQATTEKKYAANGYEWCELSNNKIFMINAYGDKVTIFKNGDATEGWKN